MLNKSWQIFKTNTIHEKDRNSFTYLRNLGNILSRIRLLHRQLTILFTQKKKKKNKTKTKVIRNSMQCNFLGTKQRGKKEKEKRQCVL